MRCIRDKKYLKKFSKENNMISSIVPCKVQGLPQVEEMLIAQVFPIMRVYIKPGGQEVIQATVLTCPSTLRNWLVLCQNIQRIYQL